MFTYESLQSHSRTHWHIQRDSRFRISSSTTLHFPERYILAPDKSLSRSLSAGVKLLTHTHVLTRLFSPLCYRALRDEGEEDDGGRRAAGLTGGPRVRCRTRTASRRRRTRATVAVGARLRSRYSNEPMYLGRRRRRRNMPSSITKDCTRRRADNSYRCRRIWQTGSTRR